MNVISQYWIPFAVGGLTVLLGALAALVWRRRRRGQRLARVLDAIAVDRLVHVLVSDGMGGQIQIEHLLLTARGLVVIDVKPFDGTIFAGDLIDEWTVIWQRGRFTFPNPLNALYDRVAALRQLVRGVPVTGHVLFAAGSDFSKGRPRDVVLPADLLAAYRKPDRAELERVVEAFSPHWERVKTSVEPAGTGSRAR